MNPVIPCTLELFDTPKRGYSPLGNVTHMLGRDWSRTNRRIGGNWLGNATFWNGPSDDRVTEDMADEMFNNGLGRTLIESLGGQHTWRGLVYEMTRVKDGHVLRRSLDDVVNHIKWRFARFTDTLVTNGSGEDTTIVGDGPPTNMCHGAGWQNTRDSPWGRGGHINYQYPEITFVTDWFSHGATAYFVSTDGCEYATDTWGGGIYWSTGVAPTANGRYKVSAVIHWPVAGESTEINIRVFGGVGDAWAGDTYFNKTITATGTHTVSETFEAPGTVSGTLRVQIWCNEYSTHFWIDNVDLREIGTPDETAWYTNAASIAKFGTKQEIVLEGSYNAVTAALKAQQELALRAMGRILPPSSLSRDILEAKPELGEDRLDLAMAGLALTLNWKYTVNAKYDQATDLVNALLGEAEFVTAGRIESNTIDIQLENVGDITIWEGLQSVVEHGDGAGNLWSLGVWGDGKLYYEAVPTTKVIFKDGVLQYPNTERVLDPWTVRPCWVEEKCGPYTFTYFAEEIGAESPGRLVFENEGEKQ